MSNQKPLFSDTWSQLVLTNWGIIAEVLSSFDQERQEFADLLWDELKGIGLKVSRENDEVTLLDEALKSPPGWYCSKGELGASIYFTTQTLNNGNIEIWTWNIKMKKWIESPKFKIKNRTKEEVVNEIVMIVKKYFYQK